MLVVETRTDLRHCPPSWFYLTKDIVADPYRFGLGCYTSEPSELVFNYNEVIHMYMGDKKKKTFMFIRLVSAAGTGFFYVKRKSAKKVAEKLEFRKYDPRVNRHVLFTEQKMK
ncbi:hypothetical protein V6N11_029438 [Hibiscus sabdariffa]|uniref:Large ribosomal subunit protein bL33c n=1 Tax=Hibiscus sabdariffa TaxID=183260 RepID=A0ABR2P6N4_9ROSI